MEAAYAADAQLAGTGVLAEAQGAVWSEISGLTARMRIHSSTGAMDALYHARDLDIEAWAEHFPALDGQVGLLAFVGPQTLGMDVIGSQELYTRLHGRFLGGYVMDALACAAEEQDPAAHGSPPFGADCAASSPDGASSCPDGPPPARAADEAARMFVGFVSAAERAEASTVGKGTYRVLSGSVVGGELEDPRPVHLSAFPSPDSRGRASGGHSGAGTGYSDPIAPPSRRRGWRIG